MYYIGSTSVLKCKKPDNKKDHQNQKCLFKKLVSNSERKDMK